MTDEHAQGERETDDIADAQAKPSEPPWEELRLLDRVLLGVMFVVIVCIVVLVLRA